MQAVAKEKYKRIMYKMHKIAMKVEKLLTQWKYRNVSVSLGFSSRRDAKWVVNEGFSISKQASSHSNLHKPLPLAPLNEEECINEIALEEITRSPFKGDYN